MLSSIVSSSHQKAKPAAWDCLDLPALLPCACAVQPSPTCRAEPWACPVQTLLNVADTHIALGEAHAGMRQAQEARAAFQRGVAGYAQACSLCSSEAGDDLPGLLHNWGVGLHTWATHTQVHAGLGLRIQGDARGRRWLQLGCSCEAGTSLSRLGPPPAGTLSQSRLAWSQKSVQGYAWG